MFNKSVNSLNSIKAWMKKAPITRKWDAILAYDRAKTNQLLMQEYIERFDSASGYLAPITSVIPETAPFEYFNGVIVSSPVLSFEDSSITSSKAKLTFDLIGGSYITLVQTSGTLIKQVTQISELSPLASDKIWLNIDLMFAPGSISGEGTVQLDLQSALAKDWRSSLGATEINRQRVAEYFYDLFDQLDPKFQVFVLNTIKTNSSSVAEPQSFVIRVHPKLGSALVGLHAEGVDKKDGQVLLFVTLKGGQNGGLPANDTDMPYLIPDEPGYSTTLLLGTDFMHGKVLSKTISVLDTWKNFPPTFENKYLDNGFVESVHAEGGYNEKNMPFEYVGSMTVDFGKVTHYLEHSEDDHFDDTHLATFSMSANPEIEWAGEKYGGLTIDWKGTCKATGSVVLDGVFHQAWFYYRWDIVADSVFYLEGDTIRLRNVSGGSTLGNVLVEEVHIPDWSASEYDAHKLAIADHYNNVLSKLFDSYVAGFVSGVEEVNVLNLQSLLFRGEDTVGYTDQYFSGDLALFGDISPQATSFSVSPLSPILVAGDVQTFITAPEVTGLVWTISGLGDDNAIGKIDSSSGKYTAPEAALLVGQLTRVRVTATNPNSGYKSSGLISVVKNSVQVNPLIQVATANDTRTLTLTAGSVAGQPKDMTWAFEDASTGATLTSHLDGTCSYVPGPAVSEKSYWVDTVVVTSGAQYSSCAVVVVNGMQQLTISLDANSVNSESTFESVTLVVRGDDGNPISGIKWAMLTGSGSVDETTGVFTVDPQGTYRYAAITAAYSVAGFTLRGFIILPLPLLAIDPAVGLLNG